VPKARCDAATHRQLQKLFLELMRAWRELDGQLPSATLTERHGLAKALDEAWRARDAYDFSSSEGEVPHHVCEVCGDVTFDTWRCTHCGVVTPV
jgi:hypothetical protein